MEECTVSITLNNIQFPTSIIKREGKRQKSIFVFAQIVTKERLWKSIIALEKQWEWDYELTNYVCYHHSKKAIASVEFLSAGDMGK